MAFNASINTGLAAYPGEISDKQLHKELVYIYRAFQNLQLGIDRIHVGLATAAADLSYGDVVNVYDPGTGVTTSRLASAAVGGNPGFAFCSSLQGTAAGSIGEVQYLGVIRGLSGITPGAIYYLSDISLGSTIITKPIGVGKIVQPIGVGMSTSEVFFNPTLLYTVL